MSNWRDLMPALGFSAPGGIFGTWVLQTGANSKNPDTDNRNQRREPD